MPPACVDAPHLNSQAFRASNGPVRKLWLLGIGLALAGCGSSGSSGGASGGAAGSGGSGGTVAGGGSSGLGGSAGTASGGAAGAAGTGGAGTGGSAGGGWSATPDWTTLPLPLQFGPVLAAHPTLAQELSVLATAYSGTANEVVAAKTSDLGKTFSKAKLVALVQPEMAEPKGIAYSPKNPAELAAVVWVQGATSAGHLFRSTDGGKSFSEGGLSKTLPFNALAFARVRYTHDGVIAIRTGSSVIYSTDGSVTSDTVTTGSCSTQPGNAEFDLDPGDGKRAALPCGKAVAFCTKAGCTQTASTHAIVDVRFGNSAQEVALIGRADDESMVAMVSTDGGKTFGGEKFFKENLTPAWRVEWDPRPGKHIVYALLYKHLFQSADGGKNWQDITPPPALNYLYDFVAAADGSLIGIGVFHYLTRPPA